MTECFSFQQIKMYMVGVGQDRVMLCIDTTLSDPEHGRNISKMDRSAIGQCLYF